VAVAADIPIKTRETFFARFVTVQLRAMLESRSLRFAVLGTLLVVASVFSLVPTPFGLDPSWMFVMPVAVAAVAGGLKEGLVVGVSSAVLGSTYTAAVEGGVSPVLFIGLVAARLAMFGMIAAILGSFAEAHHSVQKNWRALASLDPLTKVANITTFYAELASIQSMNARFALLVTDVDNLKALNDKHGHQAGSAAIQAVARVLRTVIRGSDVVARFGGDEFVVLLRDSDRAGAQIVVNRINEELGTTELGQAPGWSLSVSVGVSLSGEDGSTVEELISVADADMYTVKRSRKRVRGVEALAR
jgi:diguanylate cyclase (GGDEF)-like protein